MKKILFIFLAVLAVSSPFIYLHWSFKEDISYIEGIGCNDYEKITFSPREIDVVIPKPINQDSSDSRNWKLYSDYVDEVQRQEGENWIEEDRVDMANYEKCRAVNQQSESEERYYTLSSNLCCIHPYDLLDLSVNSVYKSDTWYQEWMVGKLND